MSDVILLENDLIGSHSYKSRCDSLKPSSPSDAQYEELQAAMGDWARLAPTQRPSVVSLPKPPMGTIVVSSQDVLLTCDYYVGTWCMEWKGDPFDDPSLEGWLLQPYSRETRYMDSFKEANRMLDFLLSADPVTPATYKAYFIGRDYEELDEEA